ncbi:hypothetical protein LZC95_29275 [Pendulispora brunnea]|uniref:Uncharacterized protein n=1 Tax=Pendulispora brunnea TaxID=2905690 RepID=A0ABZ2JZ13_9BACT
MKKTRPSAMSEAMLRRTVILRRNLNAFISLSLIPMLVLGPMPLRAFAEEGSKNSQPSDAAEPSSTSAALAADPVGNVSSNPPFQGPVSVDSAEGSAGQASVDPSTGASSASIAFRLPRARGQAQPSLGVSYSSSGGNTEVGYSWSLNVPRIERENRGGGPRYDDNDRLRINGAELVKICTVGQCSGLLAGEILPDNIESGSSYFRTRVDNGTRYFLSKNGRTFFAFEKSGVVAEFGVPTDDSADLGGVDLADGISSDTAPVFRWNLTRLWSHGHANVVVYRWQKFDATVDRRNYLVDVFDTPRAGVSGGAPIGAAKFAHHTRLHYDRVAEERFPGAAIWHARPGYHLARVDVSSADYNGSEGAPRHLVRRYLLEYYAPGTYAQQARKLLKRVHLIGACPNTYEDANYDLPESGVCATQERDIAGMTYTGYAAFDTHPSAQGKTLPFEHAFYPERTKIGFIDVSGINRADVFSYSTQSEPVEYGYLSHGATGPLTYHRGGAVYLENGNLGASVVGLLQLGAQGGWNNDGRMNFLWRGEGDDVRRYMFYSWKFDVATNQYRLVGGPVQTLPPEAAWPIPIPPPPEDRTYKSDPTTPIDIDADGNPDLRSTIILTAPDPSAGKKAKYQECYLFSTRDAAGNNVPYSRQQPNTKCIPDESSENYEPRVLDGNYDADFNGDGIPDRIRSSWRNRIPDIEHPIFDQHWTVEFGLGNGSYEPARTIDGGPTNAYPPNFTNFVADLNSDGIADRIDLRNANYGGAGDPNPGIDIFLGDGWRWNQVAHLNPGDPDIPNWATIYPTPGGTQAYHQPMQLHFASQLNNGLVRMIITAQTSEQYRNIAHVEFIDTSPDNGARPALLSTIGNGLGATTSLQYEVVPGIPGALHRVKNIRVTATGTAQESGGPYVTSYEYDGPVYDYVEHQFRGFRKVRTTSGDAADPKRVISETRYLIGSCQAQGQEIPCAAAVDNPTMAVRNLPVSVDQFDANGVHLSTSHQQYQMNKLYDGMDGRKVRQIYVSQTDTWTFDTADFVADGGPTDFVDLASNEGLTLNGRDTIASHTNSVHTRTTQELDRFGNPTILADYGVMESFDPIIPKDSAIVNYTVWTLQPGDTSHWIWRPKDSYVRESIGAPSLRHSSFEYDNFGQVLKTYADLSGTLPLQRFHEDPDKMVAPPPADASQNGDHQLHSEVAYDNFGNAVRVKNAKGTRCADTRFDGPFAQLAVAHLAYKHGCGGDALTTSTSYDRGLEVPTSSTAPTGATSTVEYDGFGRPTRIYKANVTLGILPQSEPSSRFTYFDVPGGPYQRVQAEVRDDDGDSPRYHSAWTYTDAYGQIIATFSEADTSAGDADPYIIRGRVERDGRGFVVRAYEPYFSGESPSTYAPPAVPGSIASRVALHDAFGRVTDTFGLEGEPTSKTRYYALSEDNFDAADLGQGSTSYPARTIRDGHGRPTGSLQNTNQNGTADSISTRVIYAPTGEVKKVQRTHTASSDVYTREMTYDSWGRLVQTAEPNTSTGFGTTSLKTWRYAYNDSNEIVGTSDARGCGKNVEWDGLGRMVSETYSPCLSSQHPYDQHVTNLYVYDSPEEGQEGAANPALWAGKLAAMYDRAQHSRLTYDGRGRTIVIQRQLAVPDPDGLAYGGGGGVPSTPGGEYAPHWYRTAFSYDEAERVRGHAVGARSAEVPELYGNPVSQGWLTSNDVIVTTYSGRGVTKTIGTSYGDLILGKKVEADGFVDRVTFGDTSQAVQTSATFDPDPRRRLRHTAVKQETSTPKVIQDWTFDYDAIGNPLRVADGRNAAEWPDGAKPVNRQLTYDDLSQLRRVDYSYVTSTTDDKQVPLFDAETKSGDTRPIPEGNQDKRVRWQTYDFDWQGNLTKSDDDAHAFHDRSMGTATYGSAMNGPNRIASAEGPRGHANASYDAAGNLTKLTVTKPGPTGATLNIVFSYQWDEIGRLVRANREPIVGVSGDRGADFHYTYDAGGQRITKSVEDPHTHERTYTSEIFATLRLEHARFQNGDYERTKDTVTVYLIANGNPLARVIYDERLPQGRVGGAQHIFFMLTDPMGSTSAVIDKWTGELVERTTYQAFGQGESDYRPERWKAYREHYRFSGKEDDVGVGLTYFGFRYYVPALGQWASADPLTVHALQSDLNPYAYVFGSPQHLTDLGGLFSTNKITVTNAGTEGVSYSNGSGLMAGYSGDAFQTCDIPKGWCMQVVDVINPGLTATAVSKDKDQRSPEQMLALGVAWANFALEAERRANLEPKGWGDTAVLLGKGAWNSVASTPFNAMRNDPILGRAFGDSINAAQSAVTFTPPTTPYAQSDFEAGEFIPTAVAIVAGGLGAIAQAGAAGDGLSLIAREGCFTEGTLVTTCDGSKQPIETIRPGDSVLSWNEVTGTPQCQVVVRTTVRPSEELVDVALTTAAGYGDLVHTTSEHPFWVEGKGWTGAGALTVGDEVRDVDGARLLVKDSERKSGIATVYNFEVAGNHSYFVGELQALVHNICGAAAEEFNAAAGAGFDSFAHFKGVVGEAGADSQWHHVVEQTSANVARFGEQSVHNTGNLVRVNTEIHQEISAYYSSKQPFTSGMTVRQYLSGRSFAEQQTFGREVLRMFGVSQ